MRLARPARGVAHVALKQQKPSPITGFAAMLLLLASA
jgi:hypothetical protein